MRSRPASLAAGCTSLSKCCTRCPALTSGPLARRKTNSRADRNLQTATYAYGIWLMVELVAARDVAAPRGLAAAAAEFPDFPPELLEGAAASSTSSGQGVLLTGGL